MDIKSLVTRYSFVCLRFISRWCLLFQCYTEKKEAQTPYSNRKLIVAIVGVLSLIIISATITVAAVYFGTIFHGDSFKVCKI